MKMLKLALIGIISVAIIGYVVYRVALYVDFYYYSWSAYTQFGGCAYKELGPRGVKLYQEYNLSNIYQIVSNDSKYERLFYREDTLFLSRKIDSVYYEIRFSSYRDSNRNYFKLDYLTENPHYPRTTPDNQILTNIYQMIDEMPLNDTQKEELKSKVEVQCHPTLTFSF